MLVYLAKSGRRVVLPSAVSVKDAEDKEEVAFIDQWGNIIAIFHRADVAIYSEKEIEGPDEQAVEA